MALKLADLRNMSDEELVRIYDQAAERVTEVDIDMYRDEPQPASL
jgi:hypothetical protein